MKRYLALILGLAFVWVLIVGARLHRWPSTALASSMDGAAAGDFDCANVTQIPESECEALVTFYNVTNGSRWWSRSGWLVTDTPCTWFGITCTAGHVTEVNLEANNLGGALPPELADLTQLKVLEVGGGFLSGVIPPELGSLAELEEFALVWGSSVSIPPELGDLSNLRTLEIRPLTEPAMQSKGAAGALGGSSPLPPELGNLANLELLVITYSLEGPLPPELGNLSNLKVLNLADNLWLSGPIPPEFGNLASLTYLNLSYPLWACGMLGHGDLTGPLPPELGNLSNLRDLKLGCQDFTGPIPMTFTNLGQLEILIYEATGLCEPFDPIFQAWISRVSVVVPRVMCGTQLYLPMIAK